MEITEIIFAWACGALLLLGVINCAMIFYAVYTKLDALEKHFDEWLYLSMDCGSSGGSFYSRTQRMTAVSQLITSKSIQRQEPLLIDAVQRLPSGLRFWATSPFHVSYVVCGASWVIWLYGKYKGFL
ncbi:hypothetical protein V9L13_08600 [Pseudomonas sp. RSB 5.4]|uniref:hypothetical protein n=1 Tax=Pseudomonas sp. RSB 5.4 TaxID=3127459 RepID=UPI0030CE0F25